MQQNHGSPKLNIQIPLNKTPTMVGGKLEMFGSITDMICHLEGMEEKEGEKEELTVEGRGKKRLNRVIHELSGKFEEGGGGDHDSQPGGRGDDDSQVRGGLRGGDDEKIIFYNIVKILKTG